VKHWPDAPSDRIEALERAIALAERSASRAAIDPGAGYVSSDLVRTSFPAFANEQTSEEDLTGYDDASVAAAYAAVNAAYAAGRTFDNAAYATAAHDAACAARGTTHPRIAASAVIAAMRYDYELLRRLFGDPTGHEDTPVPPEVFGSLWPDGPPKGWPVSIRT
jgi:hypothetical protein